MADSTVLGISVNCLSMREAMAAVEARAAQGMGCHVVTLNPEMVMASRGDSELLTAISGSELRVADGIGIIWALRRRGVRNCSRVPGIELMEALLDLGHRQDKAFYFIGAKPGVGLQAASMAGQSRPGLRVVGVQHGFFSEDEEKSIVKDIESCQPDFVFVALGAGRQEKWIYRFRGAAAHACWMGVGGAFDVLSGQVARAPGFMRAVGLEWLYRLATQPSRIKRMTALPAFVAAVLFERER